ncbi:MAG TPA: NnrU family protein [Alphaproteobacteria bacterium]|nr:NnrU family protein [Alphaproteobacteria bacterium]
MGSLIAACLLFLAIHGVVSGTRLRDAITARIGERAYLAGFSAASLALLVWMAIAYGRAPYFVLWPLTSGLRHLAILFAFVGVALAVLGLATPNPTAVRQDALLKREGAANGILRVTRHPFMWGVVLWAIGHMLANGDVASLLLFGSLFLLALFGPLQIDAKRRRRDPEGWQRFAAETSWLPFLAVAQGRTRLALGEIGWIRLVIALAVAAIFLFYLHRALFGVSPLPA